MDIAGQVSKQMLKHYSHIRMEAKRNALESLVRNRAQAMTEEVRRSNTQNQAWLRKNLKDSPYKNRYSQMILVDIEVFIGNVSLRK